MNQLLDTNTGVLQAVIEEFTQHRLPRLMALKEDLDNDLPLSATNLDFLQKVVNDTKRNCALAADNREFQVFFVNVTMFYSQITDKALENEQRS